MMHSRATTPTVYPASRIHDQTPVACSQCATRKPGAWLIWIKQREQRHEPASYVALCASCFIANGMGMAPSLPPGRAENSA